MSDSAIDIAELQGEEYTLGFIHGARWVLAAMRERHKRDGGEIGRIGLRLEQLSDLRLERIQKIIDAANQAKETPMKSEEPK